MKFLRDSSYTFAGMILPIVIALAATPLYLETIGPERYGALAIAWLLLGYFGQADFGIGRAIAQRVATLREASAERRAMTVWSGIVTISSFGLIAAALSYAASYFFISGPFDIDDDLRGEMISSVWLLAACSPVVAMFGVAVGSLQGAENFRLSAIATFVSNSSLQLVPLAMALLLTDNLTWLIGASLLGRSLGLVVALAGVWNTLLRGQPVAVERAEIGYLLHFGKWVMVTAIVGPLMIIADRFVIGSILGAVAVAAYTVPFQVASRTLLFPLAVIQVLFPRFAEMSPDTAKRACADIMVQAGNLFAPLIIGLVCMAEPLLHLWLGDVLDPRSVLVARIILVGFWFNGIANVPYSYLQARGRARFVAILHICELPIYFGLLFWLGSEFALGGVALAFSARCLVDLVGLAGGSGRSIWSSILKLWPATTVVCLSALLHPWLEGWLPSLTAAAILGISAVAIAWRSIPDVIWDRAPPALRRLRARPISTIK